MRVERATSNEGEEERRGWVGGGRVAPVLVEGDPRARLQRERQGVGRGGGMVGNAGEISSCWRSTRKEEIEERRRSGRPPGALDGGGGGTAPSLPPSPPPATVGSREEEGHLLAPSI
ncbi:hypothetical protein E2562_036267 [Oryza meyeriana var. granulata]|uniref:Uncharacterized protein n=1 Tax=Oryza meyeriana var. granulata TaxID=110450 RepID=A0A6G1DAM8_9ORYZ|nr:hypothetical protein E2562_036267 [Oryza meyeriana var. granulata]